MRFAARMPGWILAGMPLLMVSAYFGHTGGGGIALFIWLMAGKGLYRPLYPYPRKSRSSFPRLLFTFSGGFLVLSGLTKLAQKWLTLPLPALPGICALSVICTARLWQMRISKRRAATGALIGFLIACML